MHPLHIELRRHIGCIATQTTRLKSQFLHGFTWHGHDEPVDGIHHDTMNPRTRGIQGEPARPRFIMGNRDSRADILDDDPFRNQRSRPRIHRIHQRTDNEGTLQHEASSPLFGDAMLQFLGQENWEKPKHHTGRLWHFSDVEKQHLRLAMAAFTLALGFMAAGGITGISYFGFSTWAINSSLPCRSCSSPSVQPFCSTKLGTNWWQRKTDAGQNSCRPERASIWNRHFLLPRFSLHGSGCSDGGGPWSRVDKTATSLSLDRSPTSVSSLLASLLGFDSWLDRRTLYLATSSREVFERIYLVDGALIWQAMLADAGYFWLSANLLLGLFNMLPFRSP